MVPSHSILHVIKRNGKPQNLMFDKITSRISKLCYNLDMDFVDPAAITMRVVGCLYPGISTPEVDNLTADTAASMFSVHLDYVILAARIAVSNLHKETDKEFSKVIESMYNASVDGVRTRIISDTFYTTIKKHASKINSSIVHDRDHLLSFWGFRALESSYLIKLNGKVIESPQHMFMRVALAIHEDDVDAAINTYDKISQHWFIHSTATCYNAGRSKAPMLNSYLLTMQEDSIVGIYNTLARCAEIMKDSGGIGMNIHCIRSKGSPIIGTNGESTGIVPMLRVYNSTIKYTDLSSHRRPGAIRIYVEPWHPDIFHYVALKRNYGAEELRARDLTYALWIPDLFMERVLNDQDWTLMCPRNCPGLETSYGQEFKRLYERYEREGKGRKQVKAQQLWYAIVEAQIETGSPMMTYKDAANEKSNQSNVGVIQSSSMFGECIQISSSDEISASAMASIVLSKFVKLDENGSEQNRKKHFDFKEFGSAVRMLVDDLNNILDKTGFCLEEVKNTVSRTRPISIGVQGLADTFAMLRYPFDSSNAKQLNRDIFECMYFNALRRSCDLAKLHGYYENFNGSPLSNGKFQFDLWNVEPSSTWDWNTLRNEITEHGVRNSVLIAISPTNTTSKVFDQTPSVEPFKKVITKGKLSSGSEFSFINPHLIQELTESGLWNEQIKAKILRCNGSITDVEGVSEEIKEIYKTGWEIPQRVILDMAADRAPFIDQSQSLIIRITDPNYAKISSMHFYAWRKGLKTGMTNLKTLRSSQN